MKTSNFTAVGVTIVGNERKWRVCLSRNRTKSTLAKDRKLSKNDCARSIEDIDSVTASNPRPHLKERGFAVAVFTQEHQPRG